jgi:gluconokinase
MDENITTGGVGNSGKGHRWIWFVTGPTACGKTTVAKFVAEKLDITFMEGDDVRDTHLPVTTVQAFF